MIDPISPSPKSAAAGIEVTACEKQFDAAMLVFEAEVLRGDAARMTLATEAVHTALQNWLDAQSGLMACVREQLSGGKG